MTHEKLLETLDEILDSMEYNAARPHENEVITQVYLDRVEAMKVAINSVKNDHSEFCRGWDAGQRHAYDCFADKFKRLLFSDVSENRSESE